MGQARPGLLLRSAAGLPAARKGAGGGGGGAPQQAALQAVAILQGRCAASPPRGARVRARRPVDRVRRAHDHVHRGALGGRLHVPAVLSDTSNSPHQSSELAAGESPRPSAVLEAFVAGVLGRTRVHAGSRGEACPARRPVGSLCAGRPDHGDCGAFLRAALHPVLRLVRRTASAARRRCDGQPHVDGSCVCRTAFAGAASDDRLKTKRESIDNALDKVLSLNGFTFEWNELGSRIIGVPEGTKSVGISEQETQGIVPEAVKEIITPEGDDFLSVKYEKLVPLLIEAIKELNGKVEDLQQQLLDK